MTAEKVISPESGKIYLVELHKENGSAANSFLEQIGNRSCFTNSQLHQERIAVWNFFSIVIC